MSGNCYYKQPKSAKKINVIEANSRRARLLLPHSLSLGRCHKDTGTDWPQGLPWHKWGHGLLQAHLPLPGTQGELWGGGTGNTPGLGWGGCPEPRQPEPLARQGWRPGACRSQQPGASRSLGRPQSFPKCILCSFSSAHKWPLILKCQMQHYFKTRKKTKIY